MSGKGVFYYIIKTLYFTITILTQLLKLDTLFVVFHDCSVTTHGVSNCPSISALCAQRKAYELYFCSQVKTAKAAARFFRSGKENSRRLAGGKSREVDAARAEKSPAESLV